MAGRHKTYRNLYVRYFLSLGATIVLAGLFTFAAKPAFAVKKIANHVDLTAVVPDDFTCAQRVKVWVISPSPGAFRGDRIKLQRLMGSVRAALGFQCDNISDVMIFGQVNRKLVWRGVVSEKNGWVLVETSEIETVASPSNSNSQPSLSPEAPKPNNAAPQQAAVLQPKQKRPSGKRELKANPVTRQKLIFGMAAEDSSLSGGLP